ncbi:MMPL family transporter [Pirellulales bacterium]|nr:MMPL family transporter [Pirellulales bacterium]
MRLPSSYCKWILAHRGLILGCAAAVTALCAAKLVRTPLRAEPLQAFVDDEAALQTHASRGELFGDDDGKIIVVATNELDQLFTRATFEAIERAGRAIEQMDEVRSVASLVEARRKGVKRRLSARETAARSVARTALLDGQTPNEGPSPDFYWPTNPTERGRVNFAKLKSDMTSDEAIVGTMLSRDAQSHAMMIALAPGDDLGVRGHKELTRRIDAIIAEQGLGCGGTYFVGLPVNSLAMTDAMETAFLRLLPVSVLLLGGLIYVIFRHVAISLFALALGGMAIVWGLGATAFVYGELTMLVAGAPLVILAVSTTDLVHVTSAYQQALRDGIPQREAICQVFANVGGACVLTSLTTFVGFAALMVVSAPTVRQFGFASAVGAASALGMVLFLSPLVFDAINPPAAPAGIESRLLDRLLDRVVGWCAAISTRFPKAVICGGLLFCLPALVALYGKPVEADLPSRFSAAHPLQKSLRMMDEQFSGTASFDIYLSAQPEVLLDPEQIEKISRWEAELKSMEGVTRAASITALYRAVDTAVWYRTESGLPPSRAAAEASIAWAGTMEPSAVRGLISEGRDQLRVRVAVSATGFRQVAQMADHAAELARKTLSSQITVETGGNYPLIGRVIGEVVESQIRGLGFCIASLCGIMIVGFRSFRVGTLSQIPNGIPVICMMGIVACTQAHIDTDMLGLPMIALGLVVDDTVHFLHRYRESLRRGLGERDAIQATFRATGRAVLVSTMVLAGGLLPLALSSTLSLSMLGTYLVAGLLSAVVADLLVLPAMIQLGWMRDRADRPFLGRMPAEGMTSTNPDPRLSQQAALVPTCGN